MSLIKKESNLNLGTKKQNTSATENEKKILLNFTETILRREGIMPKILTYFLREMVRFWISKEVLLYNKYADSEEIETLNKDKG